MTKVELALVLQIIESHTVRRTYNYGAPDTKEIDNVDRLKQDIIKSYNEVMKSDS